MDEKSMIRSLPQARPRRVWRLVSYLSGIAAGLFYILAPPLTTTTYLQSDFPAVAWGVALLCGGIISAVAWFSKLLTLDVIGLWLLIIGVAALLLTQAAVMFGAPITWTRGGGTIVLAILLGFLISRMQDVRHDEKLAEEAFNQTGG